MHGDEKKIEMMSGTRRKELGCACMLNTEPAYVNYDTHPTFRNVFEDLEKLLCMHALPANGPYTSTQVQAFEGLVIILQNFADNVDKEDNLSPLGRYTPMKFQSIGLSGKRATDANGSESMVDFVRIRKAQKRKITIASNHHNRDDKKGLDYMKVSHLVSDPPVAKAFAKEFHLQVLKINYMGPLLIALQYM
ncbi:ARF guanine-nucleotide exchange factor GNL2 [Heracleum sosnowskyi]|uniref:ARF guanine-nucleotide exchange factor GNL2 n=1 Tax=Heracleum sosnowskyi TaxID=360622 RepID=A0AAD8I3V4_9APIA|nr:ARF guanine-nucleotide exchange factor GNL2 [Heracleum sosnowskyi]